jgi:hypothetical protein
MAQVVESEVNAPGSHGEPQPPVRAKTQLNISNTFPFRRYGQGNAHVERTSETIVLYRFASLVPRRKPALPAGLRQCRSLGLRVSGQHDAVRLGPMLEEDILARRAAL